jgi:hypothetical protein
VERELHRGECTFERQARQGAGDLDRPTTVGGDLPELDPGRDAEVEPGCGHDPGGGLEGG